MTREEAIKWLQRIENTYIHGGDEAFDESRKEALHMAIEALQQVTVKLNNPDDSFLTADSEACKEQKSKLDLISRAEAIEAVRLETGMRGLLGRGDLLEILYSLPSAEAEWIPCSERLPEDSGDYLVVDGDGEMAVGYYRDDVDAWDNSCFGWLERDDEDEHPTRLGKVVAWMPLPTPYKDGERSEE